MILVDTSIWVDHLRSGNALLARLLNAGSVLAHPWVIGELAMGNLAHRGETLGLLRGLPAAVVAADDEVLRLVEQEKLHGLGIGYVDAQLLTATLLTADAMFWTKDKRLAAIATRLGLDFQAAEPAPEPRPSGQG